MCAYPFPENAEIIIREFGAITPVSLNTDSFFLSDILALGILNESLYYCVHATAGPVLTDLQPLVGYYRTYVPTNARSSIEDKFLF